MNQPNNKSSLFNFEPNIVALILWIISIAGATTTGGIIMIIACFFILKYETTSTFLRNHVSQTLALALVSTVATVVIKIISPLFFFRLLLPLLALINFIVFALIFALALLGALKAFKNESLSLPLIGFIGESLDSSIKPN